MEKMQKILCAGLGIALLLLVLCLLSLPDGKLHVFVLDIGQGDSILILTPTNERILVDGGPNDAVLKELGKVMPFYEKTLDLVILTHPHSDHVDGLVEVLKRYDVKTVMMTGVKYNYSGYSAFLDQILKQKIPIIYAGAKISSSDVQQSAFDAPADYRLGSVILDMLFPFASEQGKSFENQNNGSIVFRLLYGKRIFYFSGDLEVEGEEKLVSSGLDLHADYLKVGHHGSKTASSLPFLDRVQPTYSAISCGINNTFHHPYPVTIQHFQERRMKIFRTDLDGMVEAVADGEELKVNALGK
jgi:competence protein ComEC